MACVNCSLVCKAQCSNYCKTTRPQKNANLKVKAKPHILVCNVKNAMLNKYKAYKWFEDWMFTVFKTFVQHKYI